MSRLALCLILQEIGGPVDPGFGMGGSGAHPDQGLPGQGGHPWFPGHLGGGHPDQGLPGQGGGHPSQGFPGQGGHPSQGLPGQGGHPGDRPPGSVGGLPSHPIYHPDKPTPPGQSPKAGLWVVAYVPGKGFEWVAITPGVPEKPQPPGQPDVPSIPVDPDHPDQGLPGGAPPTAGQPLPPTAAPKK